MDVNARSARAGRAFPSASVISLLRSDQRAKKKPRWAMSVCVSEGSSGLRVGAPSLAMRCAANRQQHEGAGARASPRPGKVRRYQGDLGPTHMSRCQQPKSSARPPHNHFDVHAASLDATPTPPPLPQNLSCRSQPTAANMLQCSTTSRLGRASSGAAASSSCRPQPQPAAALLGRSRGARRRAAAAGAEAQAATASGGQRVIVLYSKPDCPLCDGTKASKPRCRRRWCRCCLRHCMDFSA